MLIDNFQVVRCIIILSSNKISGQYSSLKSKLLFASHAIFLTFIIAVFSLHHGLVKVLPRFAQLISELL